MKLLTLLDKQLMSMGACILDNKNVQVKKKILFLGAGEDQAIAIRLAKEMGIKTIAVDENPNAIGLSIADIGICTYINNVDFLIKLGRKNNIDGVMAHAVEIPQVVAKVAEELDLPGITPEVAERATNKLERIKCFKNNDIPHPRFETAETSEEAKIKSEKIGFPVVIKPLDKAGARGVLKVNTKAEVQAAFEEAKGFSKLRTVLIEEYLDGKEISTESVVNDGEIYTPCWADRNYSQSEKYYPYMVEDGGELPTKLSEREKKIVEETVKRAIRALGINFGAAKGDILIHNGQPYVLEMAARTSGGRFCDTKVPLSNGVNILKQLILMHIGEDIDINELTPKYNKSVVERTIAPKPGEILSISGIERAKNIEGISQIYLKPEVKVGGHINALTNNAEKIGYVIAIGDSHDSTIKRAEEAIEAIKIITKKEK